MDLGVICLNPFRRSDLGEANWAFVLGHSLLHIGFCHGRRREGREPLVWNLACDHAIDNFLVAFKLGRPLVEFPAEAQFAGMREEDIYDALMDEKLATASAVTLAGARRPDLVRIPFEIPNSRYVNTRRRTDWEALLADGIRQGVDQAVSEAAEAFGQEGTAKRGWRPAELAKKWVMSEFPLLGAMAAHMKIVASDAVCDRMDISVAAVNPYLGEIYFRTSRGLTTAETIFVYVHELLHAALLHHTRGRGRDPWLWNVACDFVINDWLINMGVGRFPSVGGLYDPALHGMSSDEVYDLLMANPSKCKKARGFRGALGDILFDGAGQKIYRGDVGTLDDIYRRCMSAGMACMGRGLLPAGMLEEIQSLFSPPVDWDVELAHWMDANVPIIRETRRTYARASRRQASTPDIPRPARFVPQEWTDACTYGVIVDTSGSMDRELLGRALGAIASYSEARSVPRVRIVMCDAEPYDQGYVDPADLRGTYPMKGRGGTALQPAVNLLVSRSDFPAKAPVMIITDGWCEEELLVPRAHCFVLPRKEWKEGAMILRTSAPVFRALKEAHYE